MTAVSVHLIWKMLLVPLLLFVGQSDAILSSGNSNSNSNSRLMRVTVNSHALLHVFVDLAVELHSWNASNDNNEWNLWNSYTTQRHWTVTVEEFRSTAVTSPSSALSVEDDWLFTERDLALQWPLLTTLPIQQNHKQPQFWNATGSIQIPLLTNRESLHQSHHLASSATQSRTMVVALWETTVLSGEPPTRNLLARRLAHVVQGSQVTVRLQASSSFVPAQQPQATKSDSNWGKSGYGLVGIAGALVVFLFYPNHHANKHDPMSEVDQEEQEQDEHSQAYCEQEHNDTDADEEIRHTELEFRRSSNNECYYHGHRFNDYFDWSDGSARYSSNDLQPSHRNSFQSRLPSKRINRYKQNSSTSSTTTLDNIEDDADDDVEHKKDLSPPPNMMRRHGSIADSDQFLQNMEQFHLDDRPAAAAAMASSSSTSAPTRPVQWTPAIFVPQQQQHPKDLKSQQRQLDSTFTLEQNRERMGAAENRVSVERPLGQASLISTAAAAMESAAGLSISTSSSETTICRTASTDVPQVARTAVSEKSALAESVAETTTLLENEATVLASRTPTLHSNPKNDPLVTVPPADFEPRARVETGKRARPKRLQFDPQGGFADCPAVKRDRTVFDALAEENAKKLPKSLRSPTVDSNTTGDISAVVEGASFQRSESIARAFAPGDEHMDIDIPVGSSAGIASDLGVVEEPRPKLQKTVAETNVPKTAAEAAVVADGEQTLSATSSEPKSISRGNRDQIVAKSSDPHDDNSIQPGQHGMLQDVGTTKAPKGVKSRQVKSSSAASATSSVIRKPCENNWLQNLAALSKKNSPTTSNAAPQQSLKPPSTGTRTSTPKAKEGNERTSPDFSYESTLSPCSRGAFEEIDEGGSMVASSLCDQSALSHRLASNCFLNAKPQSQRHGTTSADSSSPMGRVATVLSTSNTRTNSNTTGHTNGKTHKTLANDGSSVLVGDEYYCIMLGSGPQPLPDIPLSDRLLSTAIKTADETVWRFDGLDPSDAVSRSKKRKEVPSKITIRHSSSRTSRASRAKKARVAHERPRKTEPRSDQDLPSNALTTKGNGTERRTADRRGKKSTCDAKGKPTDRNSKKK